MYRKDCAQHEAPPRKVRHELLSVVSHHQCVNVTMSGRMRDNIVKHLSAMMEVPYINAVH